MKRKILVALAIAAAPAGALQAQSMPVSQFLVKADALEKKGPMALFSSDIRLLKAEVQASGKAVRAEEAAARRAGRRPATCLPKKAATDTKELLAHFRSIPPAQRGMTVKAAFAGLMARKFPCPRS